MVVQYRAFFFMTSLSCFSKILLLEANILFKLWTAFSCACLTGEIDHAKF